MKGVAVLLDAVDMLEGAEGLDPDGDRDRRVPRERPDGASGDRRSWPARRLPRTSFPPVLDAHDVLVLPSVMRETYSLLTREALSAGLPVVCTDTLGPEEVVTHLGNGLVIPAADPGALSAALDDAPR